MLTAMDVAKCFINLFKDEEEGISNLKLQKLLYYSQGFSYQRTGEPLFNDEIEAWEWGPVVNNVYQEYKYYGRDPIRGRADIVLPEDVETLILDVAREFGQYTSSALVEKTHAKGGPWAQFYEYGDMHRVIPKECIKEYFCNSEKKLESFDICEYLTQIENIVPSRENPVSLEDWDYE